MKPKNTTSNRSMPGSIDLSNIEFNRDGVVRLALGKKKTQRKLWESMKQFADINNEKDIA